MAHPPHRAGPGTNRQDRPTGSGTTSRAWQERRRDLAADQLESDVQRWWNSWYTDPNWSWAGFPCQRDSQEQRARSRDDREWTWSRETGWQHTGSQAPLQKGKGAGKGKQGLGKGQGGGGKGKGGGKPSQQGAAAPKRLPQLLLLLRSPAEGPASGRNGRHTLARGPSAEKAMPAVAKAKGAGPAAPLLLRATPKPPPAPTQERDGRTVYKFILFF